MSSFKDLFLGWFAAAAGEPGQPVKEAAFREAYGQTIDADEDQWRKLTGNANRDLPTLTQSRMQKIAHYLWEQNILANRLVELPVAFLLAEGVKLTCDDEDNQAQLDRFWLDPINDMDVKLPKKARELALFGEQCYPAFVNDVDGMVRIGYLDPALIATVVMDPDNPEQPIGVVTMKDKAGRARRYRTIINGDEDVFTERTQEIRKTFADGDAFFYRINDLSSGTRGRSDLLAQADWLDAYDQFMFGELDRYSALRSFIWDVTLKNATADQVKARAREITAPKPASVRVHNDSETWSAETPDLKAADTGEGARLFRNHVLGGATMPEHWYGGGGDVNRAAASEMEAPTLKIYTMRQQVLKHMLQSIGRYVLLKFAEKTGKKADFGKTEWQVRAIFPELSEKDLGKQTTALQQVAAAASIALGSKLITKKFALLLITAVAVKLGVEVDPEEELAAAELEAAKRREEDGFTVPPAGEGDPGASAALQEALDLIADFRAKAGDGIQEIERLRESALHEAGGGRFTEAIGALLDRHAETNAAMVAALAGRVEKSNESLGAALRDLGSMKKTIKLPDGRKFELTQEVKP